MCNGAFCYVCVCVATTNLKAAYDFLNKSRRKEGNNYEFSALCH